MIASTPHVENGGGERVYLGDPVRPLEGRAILMPRPGHHLEVAPVEAEDYLHTQADAISYQDLHALLPFQGVVGFYEFQEYLIDDLLPHHQNLLDNIGFKGGGPHAIA